jgi:glycosyltransferase involved in cell wall biosynthesis
VVIGVPVRNGMPYLPEAIDSLRAQTHDNLVIVVSDNASKDATEEYCRAVAAEDARVVYRRLDTNVGASRNFNGLVASTDGPYFGWAAHDDRFAPAYVERCVALLERDPALGMAVPWVQYIDEDGNRAGMLAESQALGASDPGARLRCFLRRNHWYMLYGIVRRSALERTNLFPVCFGADVVLLWEMLLSQRIGVVEEPLFEYRRYSIKRPDLVLEGLIGEPVTDTPGFLNAGLWMALWRMTETAEIAPEVRRAARTALLRWLPTAHFRDLLFSDLRVEALRRNGRARQAAAAVGMVAIRPARALRALRRPEIARLTVGALQR